jgi:hypothetical protein
MTNAIGTIDDLLIDPLSEEGMGWVAAESWEGCGSSYGPTCCSCDNCSQMPVPDESAQTTGA